MANLETLTLEINGSAASASQGINQLIGSLSALGEKLDLVAPGAKALADALKEIKDASTGMKIPNVAKAFSDVGKGAKNSAKEVKEAVEVPNTKLDALRMKYDAVSEAMGKAAEKGNALGTATKRLQMYSISKQISKEESALKNALKEAEKARAMMEEDRTPVKPPEAPYQKFGMTNERWFSMNLQQQKEFEKSVRLTNKMQNEQFAAALEEKRDQRAKEWAEITKQIEDSSNKTKELAKANKEVGRTTTSIRQASHATTGLWKQIGRIAKTMMIRTAIRALMKVAKQGLQNFYQYAKSINSSYSAAIDKLGVGATKAGNQLGAAIGSLLASVAPVLNTIISLVTAAVSALTAFFSLLGGGNTFTEATDGMNAFAKAAGGGGGAMKELLADFDEFNIIAQEGGGGGGGGGFSGMFKESPIPDWMVEWKPLLEALLAGTLGAIVLPAILDGLRKIVDLFTGGGATNLLNFFKYLFRKDTPNFPDIPDGYKNFPAQPDYKPFPVQPMYTPFPVAPDYAKAAAEMVALSAAANSALPAVQGIAAALTAIGGAQLLMNAVTTLLTKLAGATMKIKVDRKDFDKFKKDSEKWLKSVDTHHVLIQVDDIGFKVANVTIDAWAREVTQKRIVTVFDDKAFQDIKKTITNWAAGLSYKHVNINVNQSQYQAAKNDIDAWTKENSVKKVTVTVTTSLFDIFKGILASWLNISDVKKVVVNMLTSTYDAFTKTLSNWLKKDDTKTVKVAFDSNSYSSFFKNANTIDSWVNAPAYKQIYTWWQAHDYNAGMQAITSWLREQSYKIINVGFDGRSFANFWAIADAIDAWASETLTKVVNVVINQIPGGGAKDTIQSVADSIAKGASAAAGIKAGSATTNNTGLGFKFESSLFAGDGGLTWNGQTIFGNGGIVQNFIDGLFKADGAYGIPRGDLFIANEAGAELIGSMNGKTTVANQGQIIEGIQRGVAEANESQNALLRQQNELLRGILEKEMNVNLGASAAFGRTVRQSLDMYNGMTGSR